MLPSDVKKKLAWFKKNLRVAAGENLVAIIGYGNLVRGYLPVAQEALSIVVVLESAGAKDLDRLQPVIRRAVSHGIEPLFLSQKELPEVADVFPVLIADIQAAHLTIHGKNPFLEIELDAGELRLRTEQEIRNTAIRLRRSIAEHGTQSLELYKVLSHLILPISLQLTMLLKLDSKETSSVKDLKSLYRRAIKCYNLPSGLMDLVHLVTFEDREESIAEIVDDVVESLNIMSQIANDMEV